MDATTLSALLVGIIGAIIGAISGGLFVVWATNKQMKVLIKQTSGSINERLYNQNLEVMRFFAEHPNLYPYFFSNKELNEAKSEEEKAQILCAADMFVGFLDLAALQIEELPTGLYYSWKKYILDQYKSSPVLRQHIASNPEWYSSSVLKLISEAEETDLVS